MKIKKGDKLRIQCVRKGTYDAVATADFDTETDEWYEVAIDQDKAVLGVINVWAKGDKIPCRNGHAVVSMRR